MSKTLSAVQVELTSARAALVEMKLRVRTLAAQVRAEKALTKQVKIDQRALRRDNAIAKAKARLEKLLSKPVGAKAARAARKPSKVTVTKMA